MALIECLSFPGCGTPLPKFGRTYKARYGKYEDPRLREKWDKGVRMEWDVYSNVHYDVWGNSSNGTRFFAGENDETLSKLRFKAEGSAWSTYCAKMTTCERTTRCYQTSLRVNVQSGLPLIPEEMGRLIMKRRPSSRSQGPTKTSLATASAGYAKNLVLRHAYPRTHVKEYVVNKGLKCSRWAIVPH
jgi:hypothetical protein